MTYLTLGGLGTWRDLAGKYRRRADVARAFARSAANTIAKDVEGLVTATLRDAAPVGQDQYDYKGNLIHQGGTLRDSIKAQIRVGAGGITVGFRAADYAKFVIGGTDPHPIFPTKAGGVLAFQVGGEWVFARSVQHPGTQANPFQKTAIETARPAINAALRLAGKELMVTFR